MSSLVSLNPANGEAVGEVPITPADKVHTIVERAHDAQGDWRKTSLQQRAALLKQAGQQLIDQSTELGELLSREMGKPLARGQGEVMHCGNWIPGKVDKMAIALEPETLQDDSTE